MAGPRAQGRAPWCSRDGFACVCARVCVRGVPEEVFSGHRRSLWGALTNKCLGPLPQAVQRDVSMLLVPAVGRVEHQFVLGALRVQVGLEGVLAKVALCS